MKAEEGKWIVVAQFSGFDCDTSADIAIGLLESNEIPAMRFPTKIGMIYDGAIGGMQPVRVLVPPDREAEARELLKRGRDEMA